jgi:enoyl-CoA hydratase/carnithine racemase
MFSQELTRALIAAFADLDARDEVNVVVLTARGPAFSMGATRDALLALSQGRARFTDVPFMYEGLLRFGKPVVAAIQGHASGGGLAFGLWADIVVISR